MIKRFLQRKNTRIYHVWLRSFMVCLCLALAGVSAWGQGETMEINDADDLYEFAKRVNNNPEDRALNAILTNDIIVNEALLNPDYEPDMSTDKTWGAHSDKEISVYNGTFDGKGFAIKGLYIIGKAFIDVLSDGGKIVNLGIVDSYVKPQNNPLNAAILCGENKGVIENCYTKSKLIIEGNGSDTYRSYGSICSENFGIIRNCHNEGYISVNVGMGMTGISVGGICGKMEGDNGGENGLLEKCYNKGCLSIKTKRESLGIAPGGLRVDIGGIVGLVGIVDGYGDKPEQNQSIKYCYNEGEIIIDSGDNLSHYLPIIAGGIIGSSASKNIESCYNTGTIKTTNKITLENHNNLFTSTYCSLAGIVAGRGDLLRGCYNIGEIINNVKGKNTQVSGDLFVTIENDYSVEKNFYKGDYAAGNMTLSFEGNTINLTLGNLDNVDGATKITDKILESGEMAWALREYGYGLTLPNATNAYPTLRCFDKNLPAVYQLKYNKDTEVIQYYNPGQTTETLPELGNGFCWFDQDGVEYKSGFEMPEKDLELVAETGYNITIDNNIEHGNISIAPDQTLYKAGTSITVTVKADEGYQFKSLECKTADTDVPVTNNNNGTYSFTMPAADVTISATFAPIEYQVNIADNIQHGKVVASPQTAAAGSVINLTVTPETGYQIKELYYKVEDSEDAVAISDKSFEMPAANVTVYATFVAIKYQISISGDIENGTVTASPTEASQGETITLIVTPDNGYQLDKLYYVATGTTTEVSITGTTFAMPESDVTVYATFTEKEDPTDPEEPVDPPVDPINYYNIYNETTYDFIDVSFSRNVVREGGSVNVYLGIPEGLDPAAVTLMFKRSLYGGWENLNTDDDGNYLINNIWTDIYVKAIVDESYIDPEPDENHIYIDLSETNDSIWLYTDYKLVEEGKTAVIQAEVAKSCQNKEIRYMYKRTVLGEWKEMPKDYSINQYVVRDITTDIYVKAYFVFDKQDPTTAKNPHHVYADITATCEGLYLDATRHKVADEGDTKVFLYVKKGFETKDARYLFKRGLKGEWEDLVPGIEQNTFQVTDIEGDIYLKGIDAVYTGTEDIDGMVRVYTKDGSLFVYTAQPEEISVVSMTGVTVKRTRQTGLQSYPLNQGIYVVCVGEQVFKVRVK